VAHHEGGHTPFRADVTEVLRRVGPQTRHRAGRGRSARPDEAARQAGLAARAALDLVPAHHRHLADRLAGARAAHLHRKCAGRRTSRALRHRPRGAHRRGHVGRPEHRGAGAPSASGCSPTTATGSSTARWTAASCCPIRASTTSATSCCGARAADAARRRAALRRRATSVIDECSRTRRCARSASSATASCSTAARTMLRLVLDQGYWPDTLLTAPTTTRCAATSNWPRRWASTACASTRRSRTRATCTGPTAGPAGLGGDAERLPLHAARSIKRMVREWTEAIERDYSHPCVVVWVPFNESWGVPDLPSVERSATRSPALYHLTKTLDPTRPVIGNDGWESERDRHHRHPRLRRRSATSAAALRAGGQAAGAVRPAPAGRAHPDARRLPASRPADHADRVRRHRLRRGAAERGRPRPGATRLRTRETSSAPLFTSAAGHGDAPRCSAASATRSSPTPSRRPTDCLTKPDGRALTLYAAARPLPRTGRAPSPFDGPLVAVRTCAGTRCAASG
jgi:hypothetical protein